MFEDENKSLKLAAARKKLKEYQQRNLIGIDNNVATNPNETTTYSERLSSNTSEGFLSECQLNGNSNNIEVTSNPLSNGDENNTHKCKQNVSGSSTTVATTVNSAVTTAATKTIESSEKCILPVVDDKEAIAKQKDTIHVLIHEKHLLTEELDKYRATYRAKELELDELHVQHTDLMRQYDGLQKDYNEQQKQIEQLGLQNAELQHKLAQLRAIDEDQSIHVKELQQQLNRKDTQITELNETLTEKSKELELSQLRIQQLSNIEEEKENNATNGNRIETLEQTQYMYEQQIRDLQAMVKQLNDDKEQANTQYQTYVQQLNTQQQKLNERNNELIEDVQRLQEREKQLVNHVQQLEKYIQKNIILQEQCKETQEQKPNTRTEKEYKEDLQKLQECIEDYEFERHEFQLKIKSQEDHLTDIKRKLEKKCHDMEQLQNQLDRIKFEQPDKNKLLATMESDKIAATRALTQNVELKQQLDELEKRFVQLTNDKAELVNLLDAEQYKNRETQHSYSEMAEHLRNYDEKFKFKDEEMIRLSNENEKLKSEISLLLKQQQQSSKVQENNPISGITIHEQTKNNTQNIILVEEHHHQQEENSHFHSNHKHEHNHYNGNHDKTNENCDMHDAVHEVKEENSTLKSTIATIPSLAPSYIPTEEAVVKLEERFTRLMGQVAELTDEKQRLEHLVLQLQSETETIGEYIALYQTQRRILKQREYERLAQAQLLQAERQQLHERLTLLNNLVNSLGIKLPVQQQQPLSPEQIENEQQALQKAKENQHETVTSQSLNTSIREEQGQQQRQETQPLQHLNIESKNLNTTESQHILHKILDIISEIRETEVVPLSLMSNNNEDQFSCCTGKFEVV